MLHISAPFLRITGISASAPKIATAGTNGALVIALPPHPVRQAYHIFDKKGRDAGRF